MLCAVICYHVLAAQPVLLLALLCAVVFAGPYCLVVITCAVLQCAR